MKLHDITAVFILNYMYILEDSSVSETHFYSMFLCSFLFKVRLVLIHI